MGSMLPPPPSTTALRDAGIHPDELFTWQPTELLWRVHRTTGGHILPWNGMRTFGPILRFDHHPLPRAEHLTYGIWYGASSPLGALAEAFQSARVIDRHHGDPYPTGLRFPFAPTAARRVRDRRQPRARRNHLSRPVQRRRLCRGQ